MPTAHSLTTGPGTRWGAVVAVAFAVVLFSMDMTITSVALPAIGQDLAATPAATQWVLLGYMLPLAALSLPAGRWLDGAGLRPAFLTALAGFALASLAAAAAPNLTVLVAARVGQGMSGSVISVIGFPVIAAAVRPEHRGRAMSIILTLIPLGGVAGPVVGAALTAAYGWPAVFLVNVPIVAVAMAIGWRTLPSTRPGTGLPLPRRSAVGEAVVLGIGGTTLFLALDLLGSGSAGGVLLPVLLAAVALFAVTVWTRLPESRGVVALLRRRELASPLVALPLMTTVVGATNFLVPYLVVAGLGESTRVAGFALACVAATMALTSPLAGTLADRFGPRPLLLAGGSVTVAGALALLHVDADATLLSLAWPLAVIGLGQGLFAGPNSVAVLSATGRELAATAGGLTSVLRTFGFSLGPAAGALCLASTGTATAGFTAGVLVLAAAATAALVATIAGRRPQRG